MTQLIPFFVFLLAATTGGFFGYNQSNEPTFGAPTSNILRTILPETTDTYDLGSASKVWANLHVTQVCLSADCKTAWPTGGGGGSFPFSSDTNYAQVVYSTSTPTLWLKSGLFASSTSRFTALEALSATTTNFLTTNATSTNATTSNLSISNGLSFGGVIGTTWAAFCTSITGGAGLCDGSDATSAGGSGTVSTSTNETAGRLAYWTSNSGTPALLGEVATGTISAGSSAITLSASRYAVGGAVAIDCATASGSQNGCLSSTDWTTFNNKENVLTAGDALTRTGDDIDFDGGAAPGGELGNTWASPTLDDNVTVTGWTLGNYTSTNGTTTAFLYAANASTTALSAYSAAFGGTATTTISGAGVITTPQVDFGLTGVRATGSDGVLTLLGLGNGNDENLTVDLDNGTADTIVFNTGTGVNLLNLSAMGLISTGNIDFGGAAGFEIPNGTGPTVDAIGEVALDTTANELLFATSTSATAPAVLKPYRTISFSYASSTQGSGTTTRSLAPADAAGYFDSIECHSNSFLRVVIYDASSNRINDLTASATVGTVKLVSNNTFTASEGILVDIGTTTNVNSSVYLGCRAKYFYTRN